MTDATRFQNLPETAIACSLPPGEREARDQWLARLGERSLDLVRGRDVVRVLFATSDETEAELRALAAAEAACCPFLHVEVTRVAERLALTISGPPEARPVIEAMFEGRA